MAAERNLNHHQLVELHRYRRHRKGSVMSQEMILIASAVLGVILVPSLITARPTYSDPDELQMEPSLMGTQMGTQPTE
jgi:hypothetical protein